MRQKPTSNNNSNNNTTSNTTNNTTTNTTTTMNGTSQKSTWTREEVRELTVAAVSSLSNATTSSSRYNHNGNNNGNNNGNHNGMNGITMPSTMFQKDLLKIDQGLISEDAEIQLEAAKKLRILLSSERDQLIREVMERDWTPKLIKWLRLRDRPTLQVEALWALTNIAAGASENTAILLQNGVIGTLVSLLDSSNIEILEQSVWVLGNLAGEGPSTRDLVLSSGAIPALVTNLQKLNAKKPENLSLIRIITWTISNLCDGQPRPVFDVNIVLPELAKMLLEDDTEILSHVCWSFSHLCDGPSTHIQAVVDSNVCRFLVSLLGHTSWRVTKPALRAIGNIVCAEDDHDYTQHIIDCGAVPSIRKLIAHSNREIQKEACWTLSNIAAGTVEQIQCVINSNSIPALTSIALSDTADNEVRSEACWVILNAASCGSDSQISYLVRQGCITVLGTLLDESSTVMMALEGLERILQVGEQEAKKKNKPNPYAGLIASKKIETLEKHKSSAVAKRASRIWRLHFVTCAICQEAFSKHSNDTFFCPECKCNVCKMCNCSTYHLQYQESLWKEETEKETEKQSKQTSKKNKKQKKRQRNKEKKNSIARSNSTISEDAVEALIEDESGNDSEKESAVSIGDEEKQHETSQTRTTVIQHNLDEQLDANDKLVSFLLETGSIISLAQLLDQDDDSVWTVAEEDRKAIHA